MKSSHLHYKRLYCTAEGFKAQQTALMHNRQLNCTAEGFTAKNFIVQQKVLLHNRQFYYMTESFAAQQKSQTCGRNWRKVLSAAEIEDKPILQCLPLDFGLNICTQTGSDRMVLWSPFRGAPDPTSFLEKVQTKRCLITSRRVSKVQ